MGKIYGMIISGAIGMLIAVIACAPFTGNCAYGDVYTIFGPYYDISTAPLSDPGLISGSNANNVEGLGNYMAGVYGHDLETPDLPHVINSEEMTTATSHGARWPADDEAADTDVETEDWPSSGIDGSAFEELDDEGVEESDIIGGQVNFGDLDEESDEDNVDPLDPDAPVEEDVPESGKEVEVPGDVVADRYDGIQMSYELTTPAGRTMTYGDVFDGIYDEAPSAVEDTIFMNMNGLMFNGYPLKAATRMHI